MGLARLLETKHHRAQVGFAKPMRHRSPEDAAVAISVVRELRAMTFARDDEHEAEMLVMGQPKERAKRRMGFGLIEAVQVEGPLNPDLAARHFLPVFRFERRQREG